MVKQLHENVINYNTSSSGIRPGDLDNGEPSSDLSNASATPNLAGISVSSSAPEFSEVRIKVWEALRGKTVVGHTLFNDLQVLRLRLPVERTRDTALLYKIREEMKVDKEGQYPVSGTEMGVRAFGRTETHLYEDLQGLKHMAKLMLNQDIQSGAHSPVSSSASISPPSLLKLATRSQIVDAWATMQVYLKYRDFWEACEGTGKDDHIACVPGHYSEWYV